MSRAQLTSTVEQSSGGAVSPYVAGKNFLVNGGFDCWQRGTSFSSATNTYTTAYSADRWYFVSSYTSNSSAYTLTRQTSGITGFQYAAKIQRTAGQTALGAIQLQQSMETVNSIPLAGKTVTLSFYAKAGANYSATSNLLVVRLYTGTGTDENIQNGYVNLVLPLDTTATLTTTAQRFSYQVTIPSTATEIGLVFLSTPTGTAGADDSFSITGVQLEQGSVATPFSRAGGTLQGELAACQRYYWRQTSGSGGTYAPLGQGFGSGSNSTQVSFLLSNPVTMRTSASYVDYANAYVYDSVSNFAVSSITINTTTLNETNLIVNSNSIIQYRPYWLNAWGSSSAYIGISAEL